MSILLLGRLHCTSFTVETNLAIYILWSAFQKYGNKVNCQKKKMLDYEKPQVQFNTVKKEAAAFSTGNSVCWNSEWKHEAKPRW